MTIEQWLVFVGIWSVAGLALGPNALNCIAVSSANGFRRSLWSVVGIMIAALTHKTAVILGVAAILLANAWLFFALKLCGAAYLVWMGLSLWRKNSDISAAPEQRVLSRFQIIRNSFLISMSNPKAIFTYLAVFSQFINPNMALTPQLIVLVPTALVITAFVFMSYCAVGAGFQKFLQTARRRMVLNRSIGSFYILAGIALAATDYQPSARVAPSS